MLFKTLTILALACSMGLQAQDKTSLLYADKLDSLKMKDILSNLCSDQFCGRKSSDSTILLSEKYIINQLQTAKLKAGNAESYKQNIEAQHRTGSTKYFKLGDFNYKDFYSYSNTTLQDSVLQGSDFVFAGYGIYDGTYNDFANIDINGKIVMILEGDGPVNKYGVKCHNASRVPNIDYISSQNPKAIIKVRQDFNKFSNYSSDRLVFYSSKEKKEIPEIKVNELLANRILEPTNKSIKQLMLAMESNCTSVSFEFKNQISFNGDYSFKRADVNNIVAVIEGSDLKDEFVVLSAHYDHIGKTYRNEVYNGADDNASGVAGVLEIARVLQQAKKSGKGPRRTVVVLFPNAEEDGLCGSDYYVNKPLFPLNKTIACVNIDMIGRMSTEVEQDVIKKGYVYALTDRRDANDSLASIPVMLNAASTKMELITDEKSSYGGFFSRSDHYNFYQKGIPSVMFTNGTHDDLHRITDDIEKIDFPAMCNRAKLAFLTVWELANNPKPMQKSKAKAEEVVKFELSIDN